MLVDCGMFQGSPEEVSRNRIPFAFEAAELDALLLTHAHLDHCGRIPALVQGGLSRADPSPPPATADLAEIVLRDAAKLQEEAEARWRRKHPGRGGGARRRAARSEADAPSRTTPQMPERIRAAQPQGMTMTRAALYDERGRGPDRPPVRAGATTAR